MLATHIATKTLNITTNDTLDRLLLTLASSDTHNCTANTNSIYDTARRWWGTVLNENNKPEQIEIDVIAESIDKKYLLVGECKWTTQENGKLLTAELLRKANLLPFAKEHIIVPILFLKNMPKENGENILLPDDIIRLMK